MDIKDFETTGSVYVVGRHFCWPPQYVGSDGCGRYVFTSRLGDAIAHKTAQEAGLALDKLRERGTLKDVEVLQVMLKVGPA